VNDPKADRNTATDQTAATPTTAQECLDAGITILKVTTLNDQGCSEHTEVITTLHRLLADVGSILQCAEMNHEYLSHLPTTHIEQANHHAYSAELRTATGTAWRLVGQLAGMRDRLARPLDGTTETEG
jgi:hypothetical protein